MARAAKSTIDHDTIRRWIESKGGHPAAVKGTGKRGDPGIIRIDFPGFSGQRSLEPISWDQFFKAFDASELALIYRDEDRFNKLVGRDTLRARARGERRAGRRAAERELSPQARAQRSSARVQQKRQRMGVEPSRPTRPAKKASPAPRAPSARKTTGRSRRAPAATRAPAKRAASRPRTSSTKRGARTRTTRARTARRSARS